MTNHLRYDLAEINVNYPAFVACCKLFHSIFEYPSPKKFSLNVDSDVVKLNDFEKHANAVFLLFPQKLISTIFIVYKALI